MKAHDPNAAQHLVTARKRHRCGADSIRECAVWIEPGHDYVRAVVFPGHDALSLDAPRPWVMLLCMPCATAHGRDAPTERRKRRRR